MTIAPLTLEPCGDCQRRTAWRCMECARSVCPSCENSMYAMCRECRAAYHGPIWQLGKRADAYIRTELARLMPA